VGAGFSAQIKIAAFYQMLLSKATRWKATREVHRTLCIHFRLGEAKSLALVEIRWPSGVADTLQDLGTKRLYVIQEGGKFLQTGSFSPLRKTSLDGVGFLMFDKKSLNNHILLLCYKGIQGLVGHRIPS
jgi:hypothetical protein